MPRRGHVPKREILPDPVYQSPLVTRFIRCIMARGKKSTADRIFYGAMDTIQERTKEDPMKVFRRALDNVKPALEVKSRRVGGSNYQVPIQVNRRRQQSLAIRWILQATRSRKGQPTCQSLARELIDAYKREGAAMTTRENIHRMAEANKAFSHFAW